MTPFAINMFRLISSQIPVRDLYELLTILEIGFSSIRSSKATAAARPASSSISIVNGGQMPYEYILFVISQGPSSGI